MTFRRIACCAAVILGFVLGSGSSLPPPRHLRRHRVPHAFESKAAVQAAELTRFMRHATAKSTAHLVKSRNASRRWVARAQRHKHQRDAAPPEPASLPNEAAAAFASQPEAQVQVVASDQFNEIDRGAAAAPVETTATCNGRREYRAIGRCRGIQRHRSQGRCGPAGVARYPGPRPRCAGARRSRRRLLAAAPLDGGAKRPAHRRDGVAMLIG